MEDDSDDDGDRDGNENLNEHEDWDYTLPEKVSKQWFFERVVV